MRARRCGASGQMHLACGEGLGERGEFPATIGAEAEEDPVVLHATAVAANDHALDAGNAGVRFDGLDGAGAGVLYTGPFPEAEGVVDAAVVHGRSLLEQVMHAAKIAPTG